MRRGHESAGRGSTRAGTAAIRNRNAVSWGGEKLSSPIFVATNARPQMTTTSSASETCERLRAPALAQDGAAIVAGGGEAGARGQGRPSLGGLPARRLERRDVLAAPGCPE